MFECRCPELCDECPYYDYKKEDFVMEGTKNYQRRPFVVEAIRVTEENFPNVADWCDGTMHNVGTESKGKMYIKVPVLRPLHVKQTYAYVGHYVVKAGSGFKVYTPKKFELDFIEVPSIPGSSNGYEWNIVKLIPS